MAMRPDGLKTEKAKSLDVIPLKHKTIKGLNL